MDNKYQVKFVRQSEVEDIFSYVNPYTHEVEYTSYPRSYGATIDDIIDFIELYVKE